MLIRRVDKAAAGVVREKLVERLPDARIAEPTVPQIRAILLNIGRESHQVSQFVDNERLKINFTVGDIVAEFPDHAERSRVFPDDRNAPSAVAPFPSARPRSSAGNSGIETIVRRIAFIKIGHGKGAQCLPCYD
ncbi:MAG: hypothetical protein R3C99_20110 [Pirellulaceae bacterium]